MLTGLAKRAVALSPASFQQELKRLRFRRQIRRGAFIPAEAEMGLIAEVATAGSCVIDVGANIGHYTCHLSKCVGPAGRVVAFEPLLDAFALLTANVQAAGLNNVTLINAAASAAVGEARMSVPKFAGNGLDNLYRAHLASEGERSVLCMPLDALPLPARVALIKVDAEGHDLQVLMGSERLLKESRPYLVVESALDGPIAQWLLDHDYSVEKVKPDSPNIVARPR